MVLILRYLKVNGFIKTSLCLALWTGAYIIIGFGIIDLLGSAGIDTTPFETFDPHFGNWPDYINNNVTCLILIALAGLTVIFGIAGVLIKRKK